MDFQGSGTWPLYSSYVSSRRATPHSWVGLCFFFLSPRTQSSSPLLLVRGRGWRRSVRFFFSAVWYQQDCFTSSDQGEPSVLMRAGKVSLREGLGRQQTCWRNFRGFWGAGTYASLLTD